MIILVWSFWENLFATVLLTSVNLLQIVKIELLLPDLTLLFHIVMHKNDMGKYHVFCENDFLFKGTLTWFTWMITTWLMIVVMSNFDNKITVYNPNYLHFLAIFGGSLARWIDTSFLGLGLTLVLFTCSVFSVI